MDERLPIAPDGSFNVEGHAYQIPTEFTPREVFAYRRLLEPIPDIPGGTHLSQEQRYKQKSYFFRRAAACVVPGLETRALESLSLPALQSFHCWILDHRRELVMNGRLKLTA